MSRGTWSSAHFGAEMACEPRFGEDRIGSLPVPPTVRCLSALRVSAEPASGCFGVSCVCAEMA